MNDVCIAFLNACLITRSFSFDFALFALLAL